MHTPLRISPVGSDNPHIRLRYEGLIAIMVAPNLPQKQFLAGIMQMLYSQPLRLQLRRDLLSQAQGQIFHPHPERLAPGSGL